MLEQQCALIAKPQARATIRAAIERRIGEWRTVLELEHVREARAILRQVVGSIVVYTRTADVSDFDCLPADALPSRETAAAWWSATVNVQGLLGEYGDRLASPTGFAASWIPVDGATDYLRAA